MRLVLGSVTANSERIKRIQIDLGKLLPLVNPILPLRASDHKTVAHYHEVVRFHGACHGHEGQGELAHQTIKIAARQKMKVPLKDGRSEILTLAIHMSSQGQIFIYRGRQIYP